MSPLFITFNIIALCDCVLVCELLRMKVIKHLWKGKFVRKKALDRLFMSRRLLLIFIESLFFPSTFRFILNHSYTMFDSVEHAMSTLRVEFFFKFSYSHLTRGKHILSQ